jgi:CcmD family protein
MYTAYSVVAVALVAYAVSLGVRHRNIRRQLEREHE